MGFKEDIERAKAKLGLRRERHLREIANIDAELKDYEVALRVAKRLASPVSESGDDQIPSSGVTAPHHILDTVKFTGSIKDLTLEILKSNYPNGIVAGELRTYAKERYGVDLNPNTLTVSLGRLKADGNVRIDGRVWFYTPKKNAPLDFSSGASNTEGSA